MRTVPPRPAPPVTAGPHRVGVPQRRLLHDVDQLLRRGGRGLRRQHRLAEGLGAGLGPVAVPFAPGRARDDGEDQQGGRIYGQLEGEGHKKLEVDSIVRGCCWPAAQ